MFIQVREVAETEIHEDGRLYLDAEKQHVDAEDPFAPVFKVHIMPRYPILKALTHANIL